MLRKRPHQQVTVVLMVLGLILAACADTATTTTTELSGTTAETTEATNTTAASGATEEPGTTVGPPSGEPIRVGSTLALTGFLGPTAAIHKLTGEMFIERLNNQGGLLGRPVEWVLLDDESVPDNAASAYERLITEENVDLIMGPYGTGTISAAIPVAERNGYVIPHHSGSLTYTYDYECAFPAWGSGRYPNQTVVADILDMLEATGSPPETLGFVVNQFPGSNFLAYGTSDGDERDEVGGIQVAQDRGYEVVVDIAYPSNISDWGPIAAQVSDADPDFLWVGALGLDAVNLIDAMDALDYRPHGEYYLWPAPGPIVEMGDAAEGVFLAAMFEPAMVGADRPEVEEIIEEFAARASAEGVYPVFETQAAGSWTGWQILTTAVRETGSLDQAVLCDWLQNNPVDTMVFGEINFDPSRNNYYGDRSKIAQLRDGEWVIVWPEDLALSGIEPDYPTRP